MSELISTSIMAPLGPRRLSLGWEQAHRSVGGNVAFVADLTAKPRARVSLAEHISNYGRIPTGLTTTMLIETLRVSNLTGRGGAGFPFVRKVEAVASQTARRAPVIVANGSESEPLSKKDVALLRNNPHLVLDGMSLMGSVLGAKTAYIYIKDRDAASVVLLAIRERRERGLAEMRISIVDSPAGYVSGQETSVVRKIEKGPALPTLSTVRISTSGVKNAPTLLSNVETFAQVALIARFGGDWYRYGVSNNDLGSRLVTIVGEVQRPGVYEIFPTATMAEILREAGASSLRGILMGGYFGGWLSANSIADLDFSLDESSLSARKVTLGCGVIGVVDKNTCPVVEAAGIVEYLAGQSAGQCGPCINGLPEISTAFARIALSSNVDRGLSELKAVIPLVERRGGCQHPDGVIGLIRSTVAAFSDEIKLHKVGRCSVGGVDHHSVLLPNTIQTSSFAGVRST